MTKHASTTCADTGSLIEARAWLDGALPAAAAVVAFVGVGTGEVLEALELRRPGTRAIVLEPDVATAATLLSRPDVSLGIAAGRISVLVGPEFAGAATVARAFGALQDVPVLVYPGLERSRPEDVELARRAWSRLTFQASANDGARRASAARYLLQTLANAPRLTRESDVAALTGLLPGLPAIVVAAGPSLDRNVRDLAPILDRAIILACDTAARPLLTVGIEPDFIVATDSSRANAGHLSSLPPARSWLVAEGSLHPSAFTHFDGRTFAFRVADHHPWPWLRSTGLDCETLDTWGSVATSTLSLALALGCNPIIFAGADFAFTDGRPYCRGTSFEPVWASWLGGGATPEAVWQQVIDRWPAQSETDVTGTPVRTASHLISFRDWIVDRVAGRADRRFVNATGAGLLEGPRIEQQSATHTLATAPVLDRALIHRHIQASHESHRRGNLQSLFEAATALMTGATPDAVQAWLDFAEPAVSTSVLQTALHSPEYRAWVLAYTHLMASSNAR